MTIGGAELDAPSDALTVADAARTLGVSVPRLRRLLSRADFAALVETRTHETRTGTRTARFVPVPVLVNLRTALDVPAASPSQSGQEANENENENEPERAGEPVPVPVVDAGRETAEVLFLRARLADALQLLAREQQAHAETRQLTARLMLASGNGNENANSDRAANAEGDPNPAHGFTQAPHTSETDAGGQNVGVEKPRPFWASLTSFWTTKK